MDEVIGPVRAVTEKGAARRIEAPDETDKKVAAPKRGPRIEAATGVTAC